MPILATRGHRVRASPTDGRARRMATLLAEVEDLHARVIQGGSPASVQRHRDRGKLPVRERLALLADRHGFVLELSPLAGWGTTDPLGGGLRHRYHRNPRPRRHGHRQRPDGARRLALTDVHHQDPARDGHRRDQSAAGRHAGRIRRRRPRQASRYLRAGRRTVPPARPNCRRPESPPSPWFSDPPPPVAHTCRA